MGLIQVSSFLSRHRRVALDTNVFIYQLEANLRYVALTDRVFVWLERRDHHAVTSTVTMAELLVLPYRRADEQQVDELYALLSTYPNLEWVAPSLEIADIAARIRGVHGLRMPDALQAATAVWSQATAMITNDPVFDRVKEFETLVLDRLVSRE